MAGELQYQFQVLRTQRDSDKMKLLGRVRVNLRLLSIAYRQQLNAQGAHLNQLT
jgi:hypothetical protein